MSKRPKLVIEPRFRITCGHRFTLGPGKASLLEKINKTGSIAKAAKALGMSYMRAWTLVKSLNSALPEPLVLTLRGGRQRGGTKLTKTGFRVLRLYRDIEARSLVAAAPTRQKLGRLLQG